MQIILSPTKKMLVSIDSFLPEQSPLFIDETTEILAELKKLSYEETKTLWQCSDKLAQENYAHLQELNLTNQTSPAVMTYKGIQYQYMAPDLLTDDGLTYLQQHLRILSGFYGILRPFDGVVPYRLEMQANLAVGDTKNLYEFWGKKLYDTLTTESGPIINLASKEYSKAITPYLKPTDLFIEPVFASLVDGKLKVKATLAKMARGEMVRFMAENQITTLEGMKQFDHPDYAYAPEFSDEQKMVFIKNN